METKELISSYDKTNDVFVGKISETRGYWANYEFSKDIFLNMDKNHLPTSIQINGASDVLDVKKSVLENSNVSILIECSGDEIDFELFIADEMIFNKRSLNVFDIPDFSYMIKSN